MKFQCYTLGCKVNQYETQAMEQQLLALGHVSGTDADDCDAYLINTCTVTAVADRKNRTLIRRLRREHPQAVIGVCGCYAQVSAEEVEALGVDVVSGSGGRESLLSRPSCWNAVAAEKGRAGGRAAGPAGRRRARRRAFEVAPGREPRHAHPRHAQGAGRLLQLLRLLHHPLRPRASALLPLAQAVEQARALEGYREVVLTGIEVASWGRDLKNGSTFADLVESVCPRRAAAPRAPRLAGAARGDEPSAAALPGARLLPTVPPEPAGGGDGVLRRMHRHYDTARYLQSVRLLQQSFPGCAVTTDLIVGFPGETEEEFAESLAFARTCGLAMVHVFPYSRRAGTPAASMPGQLFPRGEGRPLRPRRRRRRRAAPRISDGHVRHEQDVLFEQVEEQSVTGHTPNGMKVYARGEDLHNTVRRVRIEGVQEEGLWRFCKAAKYVL